MNSIYGRNIFRLYIIKCAKWFMLVMPIIVLFFQENGLSMHEIFLLKAIYSVAIIALEIPSGYFSDVWGRKSTLIVGTALGAAGFAIYSFSYGFVSFLVAEILLGIGQSFISGSDSAMLYDSLKIAGRKDEYVKLEGRVTSIGNFAEAIAGVIGGFLATISLRYPFYGQTIVAFMGVPAALSLIEPPSELKHLKPGIKDIFIVIRKSLLHNKRLRTAILYSSVIGTATLTMAWFTLLYFKEAELPTHLFGVIFTALNLTVGVVSIFAYKIERFMGKKQTIILISLLICSCYILLGRFISIPAISILFVFYITRGVATPVLKDYINRLTSSVNRATVLSIRSFIIRMLFALTGPFLGWHTDHYSLGSAFIIAGLVFFTGGAIILIPLLKDRD
jgi:MFS family permease